MRTAAVFGGLRLSRQVLHFTRQNHHNIIGLTSRLPFSSTQKSKRADYMPGSLYNKRTLHRLTLNWTTGDLTQHYQVASVCISKTLHLWNVLSIKNRHINRAKFVSAMYGPVSPKHADNILTRADPVMSTSTSVTIWSRTKGRVFSWKFSQLVWLGFHVWVEEMLSLHGTTGGNTVRFHS